MYEELLKDFTAERILKVIDKEIEKADDEIITNILKLIFFTNKAAGSKTSEKNVDIAAAVQRNGRELEEFKEHLLLQRKKYQ